MSVCFIYTPCNQSKSWEWPVKVVLSINDTITFLEGGCVNHCENNGPTKRAISAVPTSIVLRMSMAFRAARRDCAQKCNIDKNAAEFSETSLSGIYGKVGRIQSPYLWFGETWVRLKNVICGRHSARVLFCESCTWQARQAAEVKSRRTLE